jgi:hypothetical protein
MAEKRETTLDSDYCVFEQVKRKSLNEYYTGARVNSKSGTVTSYGGWVGGHLYVHTDQA